MDSVDPTVAAAMIIDAYGRIATSDVWVGIEALWNEVSDHMDTPTFNKGLDIVTALDDVFLDETRDSIMMPGSPV